MSLDGLIARMDGSIDWLTKYEHLGEDFQEDYGFETLMNRIDTILLGRKTYDQIQTFKEFPYPNKKCYVFSHSEKENTEFVEFVNQDPIEFVTHQVSLPGKDIWLVGGAKLIQTLRASNLIDEFIITIIPETLGSGIPLFLPIDQGIQLQCIDIKKYSNGLLQIWYKKNK
jgi:dihydrofolate reductase